MRLLQENLIKRIIKLFLNNDKLKYVFPMHNLRTFLPVEFKVTVNKRFVFRVIVT